MAQFTPEELTPVYRQLAEEISAEIPDAISDRLVWGRKAIRHGSKTDMILFNAWDREQTGLERNQFNYCLNYKPLRPEDAGNIWLLQVRCNIERISEMFPAIRDAIRLELRQLKNACPKPFEYRENTQTIELRHTFKFERPIAQLPQLLKPLFVKLIVASHPILVAAIDLFHRDAPVLVPKNAIGSVSRRQRDVRKDLSAYSSAPSSTMKQAILKRYSGCCAFCGTPVSKGDTEFHHMKFKSKGGLRLAENFAPLHVACHDEVHRLADDDGRVPVGTLREPSEK